MLGREPSSGHPRKPGEGLLLTRTSQTFMENCSVPGTMLVTGDTEMNRTHCPLIPLPTLPSPSQCPVPAPGTGEATKDRTMKGEACLASEPGDQKSWILIHHPQARGQGCSLASVSSLQLGKVGPDGTLVLTTGDEYTPTCKGLYTCPKVQSQDHLSPTSH